MTNRFNSKPKFNYGVSPLQSGYPNAGESAEFVMSPVGIEDVDKSLFELFDKDIPIQVSDSQKQSNIKVPVIFAGGEKWALLKKNRPLKDINGSLILPLITIMRTGINQQESTDIAGRGMHQHGGEFVVTRRLSKLDRNYQNLINKSHTMGQSGLAVGENEMSLGGSRPLGTSRKLGANKLPEISQIKNNNIFETIVIPSPQFYTSNYEVTIWTQYTHHMNQIIETLMSSYLPQTKGWQLTTPKGYWFIANVTSDDYSSETNFENMGQEERLIRCKITISVPAYIVASSVPGVPLAIKRYISAPDIQFTSQIPDTQEEDLGNEQHDLNLIGVDDPTLPLSITKTSSPTQRNDGRTKLYVSGNEIDPHDPALKSLPRSRLVGKYRKVKGLDVNGNEITELVKIINVNPATGETVYSSTSTISGLTLMIVDE